MTRDFELGAAIGVGRNRIRFDFMFEGRRYRPSILTAPPEANLRRARERLRDIKERISAGTFSFAEEFPDFRDLDAVPSSGSRRTCDQVFDAFLVHCESRLAKADLAPITLTVYRRILNSFWRPRRLEVLVAFANGCTLFAIAAWVVIEAIRRFAAPAPSAARCWSLRSPACWQAWSPS